MGRQRIYNATAGDYEEERYGAPHMRLYLRRRNEELCRIVRDESRRQSHLRILDVGCGTGLTIASLAQLPERHTLIGVDFSRTMLQQAHEKARTLKNPPRVVLGSGLSLPFQDSSFDMVYATRFVHQFPHEEKKRVYADLVRVTRPGGLVIVEFYARPYHLLRYYAQGIRSRKEDFLSHFPASREMADIVGLFHVRLPLRLAGERILSKIVGGATVERLTRLAAFWPLRVLVDEYFVLQRK